MLDQLTLFLDPLRLAHSQRVADLAQRLARHYGLDEKKASLSGCLHDILKSYDPDRLEEGYPGFDSLNRALYFEFPQLWHAFVGPEFVSFFFGIDDEAVLAAMTWHATGRSSMSDLEKVVYISDYSEPDRHYPLAGFVRELAFFSLDEAVFVVSWATILYLEENHAKIHSQTRDCYRYYKNKLGRQRCSQLDTQVTSYLENYLKK